MDEKRLNHNRKPNRLPQLAWEKGYVVVVVVQSKTKSYVKLRVRNHIELVLGG